MSDIRAALFAVAPHLEADHERGHNYIMVRCPFHSHGQERTPSLSVSTELPVIFCHACGESGHVSKLLKFFGMSKDSVQVLVDSAGFKPRDKTKAGRIAAETVKGKNPYRGEFLLDDDLLDDYRQAPISLLDAGFTQRTLRHFEVGVDEHNLRITFPLRNIYGELVGISGRAIVPGMEPRYKIYRKELMQRKDFYVPESYTMDSVKEAVLWHAHVVRPVLFHTEEAVVVTEGFKAAMWVWQSGYENVVALVGAYLSGLHSDFIASEIGHVVLFLDNNSAGFKGTIFAARRLEQKGVNFRIAKYPDEREQPDELTTDEITNAFMRSESFLEWSEHGRHEAVLRQVQNRRHHRGLDA